MATVAVVIALFIGGGVVGYGMKGLVGAFVGTFAAAFLSALVLGLQHLRATDRSLDAVPPPVLDGLDAKQAMAVTSAMLGDAFRSDLLERIEEATRADDPRAAMAALRDEHPQSAAVHAELARLCFASGDDMQGIDSATEAVRRALDGGMNSTAARLFEEFAAHRDRLALAPRHYAQLARVLRTRDAVEAAQWCEARIE